MLKEHVLIVEAAKIIHEAQKRDVNTVKVMNAIEFAKSLLTGCKPNYSDNA